MRIRLPVLGFLGLLCARGVASFDPIRTGFEAPAYAPGPVVGQDAWFAFPSGSEAIAVVQQGVATEGVASLRFDSAGFPADARWTHVASDGLSGNTMRASFMVRRDTDDGASGSWSVELTEQSVHRYFLLTIDGGTGRLFLRDFVSGTDIDTGVTPAPGTWHEVAFELDLATQTARPSIDGVATGDVLAFEPGLPVYRFIKTFVVRMDAPGGDVLYIDDVVVTGPGNPLCDGDANEDDVVDVQDVAYAIFRMGDTGPACLPGDVNADGVVDSDDVRYVIFRLGTCFPNGFCQALASSRSR